MFYSNSILVTSCICIFNAAHPNFYVTVERSLSLLTKTQLLEPLIEKSVFSPTHVPNTIFEGQLLQMHTLTSDILILLHQLCAVHFADTVGDVSKQHSFSG